jgi:methylated-DNA-[protein]-cysteine S-methyltransferase
MSTTSARLFHAVHSGPLGEVHLLATNGGLCRATLPGTSFAAERVAIERRLPGARILDDPGQMTPYLAALDAFFAGEDPAADLRLDPGGTHFQRAVWGALQRIPRGRVVTYGELATLAGRPRAVRAVGSACGANPVPLLVPCHRVVAAGPAIGGFGGGLALKRALLKREGIQIG